jgi:polyisoprenyl-phosphate glycosyltransferase
VAAKLLGITWMRPLSFSLLSCAPRQEDPAAALPRTPPDLSVVIPCYNEAAVLGLLKCRLLDSLSRLGRSWEVIFVDDGSSDATLLQLVGMHQEDARFKVVVLSRNFGQQAAILAGLCEASGSVIAILDADLQDPPEFIGKALKRLDQGFDVVYNVRKKRKEGLARRVGYLLFYRVLRLLTNVELPLDAGDFCLMRRHVLEVLKQMPEQAPFLRGMRAWAGFKQAGLEYERGRRAGGRSKYGFAGLARLAWDAVFSFSNLPLRAAALLGLLLTAGSGLLCFLAVAWTGGWIGPTHCQGTLSPAWMLLLAGFACLSGLQFFVLGCMGEYIGRIYREIQGRPRWIVSRKLGFESTFAGRTSSAEEIGDSRSSSLQR